MDSLETAARDPGAVRTERRLVDPDRPLEGEALRPGPGVVDPDHAVADRPPAPPLHQRRPDDDTGPVGAEGRGGEATRALEGTLFLPRPGVMDPDRPVAAVGGEEGPVRAERGDAQSPGRLEGELLL